VAVLDDGIECMTLSLNYRQMRWVLAVWITLSTILNLLDRQTLSVLAPVLHDKLHLSTHDYANVVTAFLISYTAMYTLGGRFVDRIGERAGMAACMLWWSVCTMLTALAQGFWSLALIRFCLGIGEPGNYPAALRACIRWFPKHERGLPIALFSSGSAIGNILAPPLIAGIALIFGWRSAFLLPGSLGIIWVLLWLLLYQSPQSYPHIRTDDLLELQKAEAEMLSASNDEPWFSLLANRTICGLTLARLITDPVWYFYIFWTPDYLKQARGFSLSEIGVYAWIPFVAGALGGIAGGHGSDLLIRRGWSPLSARKLVLYLSAAMAPLGILTSHVRSAACAIALIALMAFVAYCWFINTAALVSDLFSGYVAGSILGFMGTAGSAGGIVFSLLIGYLLSHYSYGPVFLLAGSLHVLGAWVLHFLVRSNESKGFTFMRAIYGVTTR
jgi:ACS family hexuronate transporter-like MFS transporter